MKIITILGARPQFIKAAVISREFAKYSRIEEIIVHTGQHYDANMSGIFFNEMRIPKPHYNLDIGGGTHGAMTGQMIERIEAIIFKEKPDLVLVYGDTNSTLAGALAAVKIIFLLRMLRLACVPSTCVCLKRLIEFSQIEFRTGCFVPRIGQLII